ncbi:hypothetical protein [Actinomadura sp. NPDC000929]|uniref:hypothetical protein n=1 Tax=Actinomadura sp. NPDC000929 TaxID=3154517 RepID=UPI0033958D19
MTVILVLLCLAIAGRELWLAFERGRTPGAPEIADIRTQLRDADARIRSLVAQINDRLVPDVSGRLKEQREAAEEQRAAVERLAAEMAELRGHLARRLDQAAAASLGADPADLVTGSLTVAPAEARPASSGPFERFAEHHGLRVELTDGDRYYLSGRSPRGLERDFIDLVAALREHRVDSADPTRALLGALRDADRGGARIGPLLMARTPESLVCGVLPLAELRRPDAAGLLDDPDAAARRLHRLPEGRFCDVSAWPALNA